MELVANLLNDLSEDSVPQLTYYITMIISAMSEMRTKCVSGSFVPLVITFSDEVPIDNDFYRNVKSWLDLSTQDLLIILEKFSSIY